MAKFKFNESSVPSTLEEGAIVIVDGVTYVGNSSNEPKAITPYKRWIGRLEIDTNSLSLISDGESLNEIGATPTLANSSGKLTITFEDVTVNAGIARGYVKTSNIIRENGSSDEYFLLTDGSSAGLDSTGSPNNYLQATIRILDEAFANADLSTATNITVEVIYFE